MAKLTETDKRYQRWLAEKQAHEDAKRDAEHEKEELDAELPAQNIKLGKGDAIVVIRNFIHGETEAVIEVAFDATKILNEAGLLAVGITRCLQDEKWRKKLLLKTHAFVTEELRKNREEEM